MTVNTICTSQQNKQMAFKSYVGIQIPLKAFEHCHNVSQVENKFGKCLKYGIRQPVRRISEQKSGFLSQKNIKALFFLEDPNYVGVKTAAMQRGADIDWLAKNLNTEIKPPLSKDYYTFFVLTKAEKDNYTRLQKPLKKEIETLRQKNLSLNEDESKKVSEQFSIFNLNILGYKFPILNVSKSKFLDINRKYNSKFQVETNNIMRTALDNAVKGKSPEIVAIDKINKPEHIRNLPFEIGALTAPKQIDGYGDILHV